MNAIRVRKHIDSDVLHLPELQEMIGREVEIIILSQDPGEESPIETLDTFLGDSLGRPTPSAAEIEALRLAAGSDPSLAAALAIAESGGLDVDAIVSARAESRR